MYPCKKEVPIRSPGTLMIRMGNMVFRSSIGRQIKRDSIIALNSAEVRLADELRMANIGR